jgi:hypothetical protein
MKQVVPVVSKTYDLILWVLPKLAKFPRDQRFLLAERIENALLDCLELLIEANYSREKGDILRNVNLKLEKLRFLWRISKDMRYVNITGYEFGSRSINEIGKMVGGWIKQEKRQSL